MLGDRLLPPPTPPFAHICPPPVPMMLPPGGIIPAYAPPPHIAQRVYQVCIQQEVDIGMSIRIGRKYFQS